MSFHADPQPELASTPISQTIGAIIGRVAELFMVRCWRAGDPGHGLLAYSNEAALRAIEILNLNDNCSEQDAHDRSRNQQASAAKPCAR